MTIDPLHLYKLLLDSSPCPIWLETVDSRILFLNKKYEEVFNVKLENVKGKTNKEVFGMELANIYDEQIQACCESGMTLVAEGIVNDIEVECVIFPVFDDENKIVAIAGAIIDITDRKQKEAELQKQKSILRTIIDAVPEAIFYKDKDSRYLGYNKNFQDFYEKRGVSDIIGKSDIEIYEDKKIAEQFISTDKLIMKSKQPTYYEQAILENNEMKYEEIVKVPVIDEQGDVLGVVGLARDITERKNLEERLRYLSEIDMLTGLYNRHSFEEKATIFNDASYMPLGMIMGDVNGLKLVNDTIGHLEGDKLLKRISTILKESTPEKGLVFRWGGDEFMILVPNCDELECEVIMQQIAKRCEEAESEFIQLSISLAEVVKCKTEQSVDECLKKVEEKVYRHKLLENKSLKSTAIDSLQKMLEEKNMETQEHTLRVAEFAQAIGHKLNLKRSELDELELVAKLHDIGKIGISEEILMKPGKLTDEEFEIMKTHAEKGYRIMNASSELHNVAKCILTHHERYDGRGYPLGLTGEETPLLARIVSVVDAYDVMTSERVYKKAMSKEEAIAELKRCSGTQFDPVIVNCFIETLS